MIGQNDFVVFKDILTSDMLLKDILTETGSFFFSKYYDSILNGETLLTYSCALNRTKFVRFLLEIGADKTIKNKHSRTALDESLNVGNEELISLLNEDK